MALKSLFQLTYTACIVHHQEQLRHQHFLYEVAILHYLQHNIHASPIWDNDDKIKTYQELYSPKYLSTRRLKIKLWNSFLFLGLMRVSRFTSLKTMKGGKFVSFFVSGSFHSNSFFTQIFHCRSKNHICPNRDFIHSIDIGSIVLIFHGKTKYMQHKRYQLIYKLIRVLCALDVFCYNGRV